MTVGGFYAHFPSKDELIAESVREAMRGSMELLDLSSGGRRGAGWIESASRRYLSRSHRDNPSLGCPLPATASEVANAPAVIREAFGSSIDAAVDGIAVHLAESGLENPRGEAIAVLALMLGGMTLARALKGTPGSDEVLEACREHIKGSYST